MSDVTGATADTEVAPAPVVARRGRSGNSMAPIAEPLAPDVPQERITPAVEPETAAAATVPIAEPAPAAGGGRPSTLAMNRGQMAPEARSDQIAATNDDVDAAPEAPSSQAAGEAKASTASADIAQAIDAPQAPRDADGNLVVTDDLRARARGDIPSEGVKAPDSGSADPAGAESAATEAAVGDVAASDPEAAPEVDALREDAYVPPIPVDDLHAMLLQSLARLRGGRRDEVGDEIEMLGLRRAKAAEDLQRIMGTGVMQAQAKAARAAASAGAGGGGGGLLSGIGSGVAAVGGALGGAIGRAVNGDPEKEAVARLKAIDHEISQRKVFRRIVLDHQMPRTIEAADRMYRSHRQLSERVNAFNTVFGSTKEGGEWLSDLQSVADARGVSTDQVRAQIHAGGSDPEISGLASRARNLLGDPEIAKHVSELEDLSRSVRTNAERMRSGLETVGRNGVALDDLDGGFTDAISGMKCEDCALARPGGERIDGLKARMKEMTEKLVEGVRALIERLKSAFGIGQRAPAA